MLQHGPDFKVNNIFVIYINNVFNTKHNIINHSVPSTLNVNIDWVKN